MNSHAAGDSGVPSGGQRLQRQRERLLERVLGQLEVAQPADERGQHLGAVLAEGLLDGLAGRALSVGGIPPNVTFAAVIVRRARHDDLEAAARRRRVARFRDDRRGDPAPSGSRGRTRGRRPRATQESVPGVLSLGMAISRARPGGAALLTPRSTLGRAAHKISLEVWTDNARAIALYAAAGFEVEGLRRDHYRRRDGRLRSTLIMAWRADNG